MGSGLEHLLAEGIISEVLARLKSGKEADVYVVRYGGQVVAAKVYKDRAHRSFKNNSAYKEGRTVRSSRSQRAIDRKTKFGQAAAEDAWKSAEADALYKLHAADVRVPTPVMFLEGVLLMELVLDADGEAAPRLVDTALTVPQANAAYRDMLTQLVRILSCDLIHGDLSPYNVLWAASGPTIIDFPQIISASHNSSSESFFLRDARNILGHFAAVDRSLHARSGDAAEIWRAYVRRELSPDFMPTGRSYAPPPRPRIVERVFEPNGARTGSPQGGHREGGNRDPRAHGVNAPGRPMGAAATRGTPSPNERATHDRTRREPQGDPRGAPRGAGDGSHAAHSPASSPRGAPHGRPVVSPRRPSPGPEVIVRAQRSPHAPSAPRPSPGPAPRDDRGPPAFDNDRPRSPGRRRRRGRKP